MAGTAWTGPRPGPTGAETMRSKRTGACGPGTAHPCRWKLLPLCGGTGGGSGVTRGS
jgi:hypothetical protein